MFGLMFFCVQASALESLSYSGRLVQLTGAPVAGPVNLRAELVYTNSLSTVLCSDDISNVSLSKGVFHVKLDFACSGGKTLAQVLSQAPTNESVAIQITDVTNSKKYSFQALHALPYASVASQLAQMGAGDGEFLKWDDLAKQWKPGSVSGASGGTVTTVSATAPLAVATATSTPAISISQANTTTSGYLSSADWNAFNSKEGTIAAGTAAQYYRGDKSWQTLDTSVVPENVNLYFTNARALGVPLTGFVTAAGAIVATDTTLAAFGKTQGQINAINTASANYLIKNSTDAISGLVNVGTTGLLQLNYVPVGMNDAVNKSYTDTKLALTGGTLTGVLTLDDDLKIKGGSNHVTVKGHATSASYNLTLPQNAGTAGFVLSTDGSGNTSWVTPAIGSSNITDGSIVNADVNAGAAIDQSKIANLTTDLAAKEPTISLGTTAQYWKGNKTWASLQTDVQALVLSGFTTGSNATLANTDTVSGAFGKVQGQIDAINSSIAGKEASFVAGSNSEFYRGDKSWQTLNGGAVANTPVGNIAATTTQNAINELDSEKQDKLTATSVVDNRELRFYELPGNGTFYSSLKSPDDLTANINYTLPLVAPTLGQVLSSNASGVMSWITIPSAPVTTVFGRNGVVAATAGDYTASQITNTPAGTIAATDVQTALNELATEKEGVLTNPNDTTKYYRGDKTWATFATDAINSVLSTFSVGTGTKPAVTNTDTVVGAFGKVQKTLNDINSDYVSKSADQTINGSLAINSLTGFITVPNPINPTDAANKTYVDSFGQWAKNGSDINYGGGKVGIGTTTPGQKLSVVGTVESTSGGFKFPDGSIQTTASSATAGGNAVLSFTGATSASANNSAFAVGTLYTNNLLATNPTNSSITITTAGNYSISVIGNLCAGGANGYVTSGININGVNKVGASNLANSCGSPSSTITYYLNPGDVVLGWCSNGQGMSMTCVMSMSAVLPAGGIQVWNQNSTDAYYNIGNVGIGTMNPVAKLHIGSGGSFAIDNPGSAPSGSSISMGSPQGSPGISIARGDGSNGELKTWQMRVESDSNFIVQEKNVGLTTGTPRFVIAPGGKVGIGTTTPQATLDVNGSISSQGPAGEATSGSITAGTGGGTTVSGYTVSYSVGTGLNATTGFFQPTVAGRYLLTANAYSGASSNWVLTVCKNGSCARGAPSAGITGNGYLAHFSKVVNLNGSSDYATVAISNYSGSTATIADVNMTWTKLP
jgi:hypothetical protein